MGTLALSMIVKNAEKELGECLGSVRAVVQEMVVADTGSEDRTREVAEGCGARVVEIPWENDFAKARNLALAEVRSEWVLALDADERLDPGAARVLPEMLKGREAAGYLVTIRNYVLSRNDRVWDRPARANDSNYPPAAKYPAYVEHENVRVFRRDPAIYFVGRVHESVGPRIEAAGKNLRAAPRDFFLHHFGLAADAGTREAKNRLYLELGQQKIREAPENAQAHFELGLAEFDNFHNASGALELFERASRLNPRLGVAWFFAALAQMRLGKHADARKSLARAADCGHDAALVSEAQGDAQYNLGEFESAAGFYRKARNKKPSGALESKLGLAEVRMGNTATGFLRLKRAAEHEPEDPGVYDRLIAAAVWMERLDEAADAAERKLRKIEPHPDYYLRAASIRARMQDWEATERILRAGLKQFPEAEKLREGIEEVQRKIGVV